MFNSKEKIDESESTVKRIGRKYANSSENNTISVSDGELSEDLSTIRAIMGKYSNKITIQRVCCHAISNMAINQNYCASIVEKGIHTLIEKAIKKNKDWKLIWLGFSAIWNLARPPSVRQHFTKNTITLCLNSLKNMKDNDLVCETTLGALSNLMLNTNLRETMKKNDLSLVCEVIDESVKCSTLTAGAGLLTNLAHNNDMADILNEFNAIEIVLNKMEIFSHDSHLLRNSCAALSNLTPVENYLESFLNNKGVEKVISAINLGRLGDDAIIPLAEQALIPTEIDLDSMFHTTSLHISVQKSLKNSVDKCLLNGIDINEVDTLQNTPLHYAVMNNDFEMVRYLVSHGSDIYIKNLDKKSSLDISDNKMRDVIKNGLKDLKELHIKRSEHITESSLLISDISMIVSSYENPIDIWELF